MAISPENRKKVDAQNCTQVGTVAGFKAAAVAVVASAIPMVPFMFFILIASSIYYVSIAFESTEACIKPHWLKLTLVRVCPWAKANLNHTGQALIMGGAAVAGFFINSEKTLMDGKKRNIGY